jgi:hypothetical protein
MKITLENKTLRTNALLHARAWRTASHQKWIRSPHTIRQESNMLIDMMLFLMSLQDRYLMHKEYPSVELKAEILVEVCRITKCVLMAPCESNTCTKYYANTRIGSALNILLVSFVIVNKYYSDWSYSWRSIARYYHTEMLNMRDFYNLRDHFPHDVNTRADIARYFSKLEFCVLSTIDYKINSPYIQNMDVS